MAHDGNAAQGINAHPFWRLSVFFSCFHVSKVYVEREQSNPFAVEQAGFGRPTKQTSNASSR